MLVPPQQVFTGKPSANEAPVLIDYNQYISSELKHPVCPEGPAPQFGKHSFSYRLTALSPLLNQ